MSTVSIVSIVSHCPLCFEATTVQVNRKINTNECENDEGKHITVQIRDQCDTQRKEKSRSACRRVAFTHNRTICKGIKERRAVVHRINTLH